MALEIKHTDDGGIIASRSYYDLKIDLMQLFPQNYALDSSGSYETKIEFLSDYIEQRAMQLVEERLKN